MSVTCESTRYGRGCGHPVEDHTGPKSPNTECCCCNWWHNEPSHQDDCIECHRRRYATPGMTAGEFAECLPEHLRQEYWRQKLDEYFTRELSGDES